MSGYPPAVVSVFGINPIRIGGNETFARELSLQLERVGWKSVLCMLDQPPETVRQFLDLPNVQLETFSSIPVSGRSTMELGKILHRHRPRILHLHFVDLISPYPWLGKLYGAGKIFFTDQSSPRENSKPKLLPVWKRSLARFINAPMTKVISVSEYKRSFLAGLGTLPVSRQMCIYNAVDLSRIPADGAAASGFRRRFGIPEDRRLIVQVSMIIPEKGIADLLDAARIVVAEDASAHFVLVGEGAGRAEFERKAEAMGIKDHVTFTGQILDPCNEGVFAAAALICQVSRWQEAFGWVIAEGMAFGKPLVGTRVGGIPELIEDGVTGYLAGRGDSRQIAAFILSLLHDPSACERMGRAGRLAVEKKFNLRNNVVQLMEVYGLR
ncbi:MAG: glycosyltransferase family 1 protein [Bryobacterales bacterium]|nr:glycosyltransferase family 1 protein [Bryobacterales bacterium]